MIVLMRHAQTKGSKGMCIGRTPLPLSNVGIDQSHMLAKNLQNVGFKKLCSSPSRRALDTITPLANLLGLNVLKIVTLDEIDMGQWDGMSFDEIRQATPEAYTERGNNFANFRPPEGECFNEVADRALEAIHKLSTGTQPVLVSTHAGVIRAVLCRLTNHSMNDLFYFNTDYAKCTILESKQGKLKVIATEVDPKECRRLNDARG